MSEGVSEPRRKLHVVLATAVALAAFAYTMAVIVGWIPAERQIDATHLGVITIALVIATVLLSPDIFRRLRLFEVKGIRIELLERVQEKQLEQEAQLRDIRLIIPLLLPEAERKHLRNLARGRTGKYRGSDALRAELRRLRSIGLIRTVGSHWISHLEDNREVDLAGYVELTDLGKRWAARLDELEEPKTPGL